MALAVDAMVISSHGRVGFPLFAPAANSDRSEAQAWLSPGERPGERVDAASQTTLVARRATSGQDIRPIGAVLAVGGLARSSGLTANPTIWPRSLIPNGAIPCGARFSRPRGIAIGLNRPRSSRNPGAG